MKALVLLAAVATFAAAAQPARADAPGPGAGMSPHYGRHGYVHGRHHAWRSAQWPGVLGMERGGVLYWRPAVDPMPEHVIEIVEPSVSHRRTVRALY